MTMEWQPIETAPKDGTAIILYEPVNSSIEEGPGAFQVSGIGLGKWHWPDMGQPGWFDYFDLELLMDRPTHWMPLPTPPQPKDTSTTEKD